jgi:hypothetical protein
VGTRARLQVGQGLADRMGATGPLLPSEAVALVEAATELALAKD